MSKTLILLDTDINIEAELKWKAGLVARLQNNGRWDIIKSRYTVFDGLPMPSDTMDFVDLFMTLVKILHIDLNAPEALAPRCICPVECDCQDSDNGLCSNSCPVHNENPVPDPDCPQHSL